METRRALIAGIAVVLAGLSGAALAGGEKCEERCDERQAECESKAEIRYDECARDAKREWRDCSCASDVLPEDVPARCAKVCRDAQAAIEKCDAKLEKQRDKCQDKADRCSGNCD